MLYSVWANIFLIPASVVAFYNDSYYISSVTFLYAVVDSAYHACEADVNGEWCLAPEFYDLGWTRFTDWSLSRSLALALMTQLLFRNQYLRMVSRYLIELVVLLVSTENSHSFYQGDVLIAGLYLGLWTVSLLFDLAPRVHIPYLLGMFFFAVLVIGFQVGAEIYISNYDYLHGLGTISMAGVVICVSRAPRLRFIAWPSRPQAQNISHL